MRFALRIEANSNGTVTIATLEGEALHVLIHDGEAWEHKGVSFRLHEKYGYLIIEGENTEEETIPWRCSACTRMIPGESHAEGCAYVAARLRELEAIKLMSGAVGRVRFLGTGLAAPKEGH